MFAYKSKVSVGEKYKVVGFISSGTYGRVYKAIYKDGRSGEVAIKQYKPDKDGEAAYTGISQSACRELALSTELSHPNIIRLVEIILEDKSIYMVLEFAEHDLLQLIQYHTGASRRAGPILASTIRSILYQLLNGCLYLHSNWVLHRDLKPANIMLTSSGRVQIGDLGLARLFQRPLLPLFSGDKVVVTIWYRAPELLLGSRHYTPAIDLWAIGCIFAELFTLRPFFKGEENKMDNKKQVSFQKNQMQRIVDKIGLPTREVWPNMPNHPQANELGTLSVENLGSPLILEQWWNSTLYELGYREDSASPGHPGPLALDLLQKFLTYDPEKRVTAEEAMQHPYFIDNGEMVDMDAFAGMAHRYPPRKIHQSDDENSLPGVKRAAADDPHSDRLMKKMK